MILYWYLWFFFLVCNFWSFLWHGYAYFGHKFSSHRSFNFLITDNHLCICLWGIVLTICIKFYFKNCFKINSFIKKAFALAAYIVYVISFSWSLFELYRLRKMKIKILLKCKKELNEDPEFVPEALTVYP